MRLRRQKSDVNGEVTIFFATDIHGSEVCFRKFVAAAAFYGADLLVLGGDLTGKLVVPLVEEPGGYVAELHGETTHVKEAEADAFERRIADEGLYPVRLTAQERKRFDEDPSAVDELFKTLMKRRLKEWIEYAKERLDGTRVKIITTPGNDDPPQLDEVIREHGEDRVLLMEGEVC
jgi:uncharacterized protein